MSTVLLVAGVCAPELANAQYRSLSVDPPHQPAWSSPLAPAPVVRVDFPTTEVMLRQSTAGLIGGLAGTLAILLPLAASRRGDGGVSDDAMTVGAIVGFVGGSTVGVQLYSDRAGMRGSWWGTLAGATVGALGGPLLFITTPLGSMAGYNLTRED